MELEDDIYRIVFGIMLILIIFGVIFEFEKNQREREAQIKKQIKNVYEFLGKKKRYFIMEPTGSRYFVIHKYIEVDVNNVSFGGLQKVNYRDILPSKTYLKVSQLDDDFNLKTQYFLYNKN